MSLRKSLWGCCIVVMAAALVVFAAPPAICGPSAKQVADEAEMALDANDYAAALKLFAKAVDMGHAEAMCGIGVIHENGYGVPQNYAEAARWYKKAADAGSAAGAYDLAIMYESGRGVPKNHGEHVRLMIIAAERGDPTALAIVGAMYVDGSDGCTKDVKKGYIMLRRSARLGEAEAMRSIGIMYEVGIGVAKDAAEALRWYKMALENGCDEAAEDIKGLGKSGAK